MTKQKKAELFDEWEIASNLNKAKDSIYDAVEFLEEHGMHRDAETLEKMIFRIEAFQNKYR